MADKYVMIPEEKFNNVKREYDKLYGELSNRLVNIVALLSGYDNLDIECECLDFKRFSDEDRTKRALEGAKELMSFLEAVEEIHEWECERISENDLKQES